MHGKIRILWTAAFLLALVLPGLVAAQRRQQNTPTKPILWQESSDIAKKDLRYGPGSPELGPRPPFTFVEEDKSGESPKLKVKDAANITWSVKLGPEAQAEVVASRLVWAMGYFAEESYYLDLAEIKGLPRLSRGRQYVRDGRFVRGARFEPRRDGVDRGANWDWLKNPFVGTREFNGLKTMMVLLANYDTSVANNRILTFGEPIINGAQHRYVVTDLGATLGKVGGLGGTRSKNNLSHFRSALLVKRVSNGMTEFQYRTRPSGLGYLTFVFHPRYWQSQTRKEKAMRRIPTDHVRWIAARLSRLRDEQLRDAFDAASYDAETANGFIDAIRGRIRELNAPERNNGLGRERAGG